MKSIRYLSGYLAFVTRFGIGEKYQLNGTILVLLLYLKKGDMGSCENYRPICLINTGYKLFVSILLTCMKKGGVNDRIWGTPFGFRKGKGIADAILLARCLLE